MTRGAIATGLVLGLALAVSPARADDVGLAQQAYTRGLERYQRGDFAGALDACTRSYQLAASPNSRLCIARSLRKLGRLAEAATAYELTLAEATDRARTDRRYRTTAADARAERDALTPLLAEVEIVVSPVPPGIEVQLGARVLPAAALALPIPVDPGTIEVSVRAPGHEPARRTLRLAAGAHERLELTLTPLAPAPAEPAPTPPAPVAPSERPPATPPATRRVAVDRGRSWRRAGWIVGGGGVALLATGGVLAYVTDRHHDDLVARCGEVCPPSEDAAIDRGERLQRATNLALGTGVALAGAGTVLYLLAPSPTWRIEPVIGPGEAGARATLRW